MADRCYFVESVPNNELPYGYSWCDCMCTPSRWEGFGFVFIEAAACETAIVTSNVGPMNEYLNRDNSILVDDFENPIAIANAILTAVEGDPDEIQRIRKNARKVGLSFSKETVDRQEIEIYRESMQMDLRNSELVPKKVIYSFYWGEAVKKSRQYILDKLRSSQTARKVYHILKKKKP